MGRVRVFNSDILGSALGVTAFAYALGSALGPAIAGLMADLTGSRVWPIAIAAAAAAIGISQITQPGRPHTRRRVSPKEARRSSGAS